MLVIWKAKQLFRSFFSDSVGFEFFFFLYLKFPRRTEEVSSRHSVTVALVVCYFSLLRPEAAHNSLNLENKSFNASTCISSIDADGRGRERGGDVPWLSCARCVDKHGRRRARCVYIL